MDGPTIWLAGDWQHADFTAPLAWLRERAQLHPVPSAAVATRLEGILIAQSRPGLVARREVERLHALAPLSRLVALLGPWCEGEQRSGRPWPGVVRVAWNAWPTALSRALGLADDRSDRRLPRTATDTERLQNDIEALVRPNCAPSVAIRTNCRVTYDGLHAALLRLGCEVVTDGAVVEVIDGWDQWPAAKGTPRVLLLHFPRPDDLSRAEKLGAAAVLAQPLALADLAATLSRLCRSLVQPGAGRDRSEEVE